MSPVFPGLSALRGGSARTGKCPHEALGEQRFQIFVSFQRTCGAGLKREAVAEH